VIRKILLAAIALLLTAQTALADEQAYTIRLSRPSKIGDRYRIVAKSRHSEKVAIFAGEVPIKSRIDDFNVELVGTLTIQEVAGNGNASKSTLLIGKFLVASGQETKALFPAGTIVIISIENEESVYRIDGGLVDAATEKALRTVLSGAGSAGPTDDEAFGTNDKQKVGDTWQVNRDLLVKSFFQKAKMSVDIADVKSSMTLQGVVKGGPRDYLVVGGTINIERFTVPLPQEFKTQKGQIEMSFSGQFPTTEDRTRLSQSLQTTAWFSAVGPADLSLRGLFEDARTIEFQDPN
jgi:hypothetical protein